MKLHLQLNLHPIPNKNLSHLGYEGFQKKKKEGCDQSLHRMAHTYDVDELSVVYDVKFSFH